MNYQIYLLAALAISVITGLILFELHRRSRDERDKLYVMFAGVRSELEVLRLSAAMRQEECDKVNKVCTQYRNALMVEEQQYSGRYNRTYEILEGREAKDGRVPIPKSFTSGRVAAFFLTDWDSASSHLAYWENLGRLYSIERGTTSKLIDGYTIKVS